MKRVPPVLLVLLCLGAAVPQPGRCGTAPEKAPEGGSSVLFPVAGYTPETKVLLGATWLRFFHLGEPADGSRASTLSPVLIFSTEKQTMALVMTDLNWGAGRHHLKATPQYQRFPDKFFGLGRGTPESAEESFTPELFSLDLLYERRVLEALAVGATFHAGANRLLETEPGGLLDVGNYAGTGSTTLTAPGLRLAWDTRDNTWSARRGSYLQAQTAFYRDAWGSDFHYTEFALDLRRFLPLAGKGSLAFQVAGKVQDGSPPFYALPRLGGFDGLRGYLSGRYLDRTRLLVRAEWRSAEFWKGLGCAVFTGIGDVAPTPARLTTSGGLYTFGGGLRYLLNREQQVKIRVDYGFGNGSSGFYFGLGEAF